MANGRNGGRRRQALTGPAVASFYVDASGMDDIAKHLAELDVEVREALRPMAYAGAKVIYDRAKMNVAGMGVKTGNLLDSIYTAHMKESSTPGQRELYRVSWNLTKAPHGRLLEWGWVQRYVSYINAQGKWETSKKQPLAKPIFRPGYAFMRRAGAAIPQAQAAMVAELNKRRMAMSYYGA